MRIAGCRIVSMCLTVVLLLSGMVTGTLSWQSYNQQAKNESGLYRDPRVKVELIKLEKLHDGTETQTPVPGAAFYLFDKTDGAQIGARYTTDVDGKLVDPATNEKYIELKPGEYYFEEAAPAFGYTFDTDASGQRIMRYAFTVTGNEPDRKLTVTAYNVRLEGALTVQKVAENADDTPLTGAQQEKEFTFAVTFSDADRSYTYAIDGGTPVTENGPTLTFKLKHGQTAVFQNIPVGVSYTVAELADLEAGSGGSSTYTVSEDGTVRNLLMNYTVSATGHQGTITQDGCTARFTNTFSAGPSGGLTIEKTVEGDGADTNKPFTFTGNIGGVDVSFTLKHGEQISFTGLPVGTEYTIKEGDYQTDGYVANIGSYTGTIGGENMVLLPFINVYTPTPTGDPGSLQVKKVVTGDNADPGQPFTFEVTFSDADRSYTYAIDGGTPVTEKGPTITFQLKHDQTALFSDIPEGTTYVVREVDPSGYRQDLSEAGGTIIGNSAYVTFRNHAPTSDKPATLRVTKQLAGEYPAADKEKRFHFTLLIDGAEQGQGFELKNGESTEFKIPAGSTYEVRENDYIADGYALRLENGLGTARAGQTIEATATNTYFAVVQTEIAGEKTWELGGRTVTLPEFITVQLKGDGKLVEEKKVTPDANGQWLYTFTAPKYDADGNEITYTVEETPILGFDASYNGTNITNTYVPPVEIDPPIIQKVVEGEDAPKVRFRFLLQGSEGAPMPAGSEGQRKVLTLDGHGEVEIGTFAFYAPGVYSYTVSELNEGEKGWTYDNTVYTLTFTVTRNADGSLNAQRELTKVGEPASTFRFVNHYTSERADRVTVSGSKTWRHGDNTNLPDSVTVYVYADGKLAAQRLVSAADNWRYVFDMPKYAEDGHKIVYSIDEANVPHYSKTIDGYDLINTYRADAQGADTPDNSAASGTPNNPKTGDDAILWPWIMAMILSTCGLIITIVIQRRQVYHGKRKRMK